MAYLASVRVARISAAPHQIFDEVPRKHEIPLQYHPYSPKRHGNGSWMGDGPHIDILAYREVNFSSQESPIKYPPRWLPQATIGNYISFDSHSSATLPVPVDVYRWPTTATGALTGLEGSIYEGGSSPRGRP